MRKVLSGAIAAVGLVGATLAVAGPASADEFGVGVHVGDVGIGVNVGDVAYGYQDGYWDNDHRWHEWRSDQEMRDYRNAQGSQYSDWRHDRDSDQGWRDIRFSAGDVAYAYQDGYWDRGHHWHHWRNDQQRRDYRSVQGSQYSDWRHDRDGNLGWIDLRFNAGDVAYGYQDGYWDRNHNWHQWRNDQEMRDYRNAQGNQYSDWRHDRDSNQGWHDLRLNVGDVAFGYQDGYWDRGHQWHQWRDDQEMRDYRNAPGNNYNDYRHDRDDDNGWHS